MRNSTIESNLCVDPVLKSSRTFKYAAVLRSAPPANSFSLASFAGSLLSISFALILPLCCEASSRVESSRVGNTYQPQIPPTDFIRSFCNPTDATDRLEYWREGEPPINRGLENKYCPPWDKSDGRHNYTCLVKDRFNYPNIGIDMVHTCAESTAETSYSLPKIRVRNQTCNVFGCWSSSETLGWEGECINWASPWGIPLNRVCARLAVPGDAEQDIPADPGYTFRKHLTREGAEVDDEPFMGTDGQPVYLDRPKLCAYMDPSLMDTIALINPINLIVTAAMSAASDSNQFVIDLMDYNPDKQPIHNTGGIHPIAKLLISVIKSLAGGAGSISDAIGSIISAIPDANQDITKGIFDTISDAFEYVGEAFVMILEEFGQFNRVVLDPTSDKYHLGCVEIPVGPYPPQFCPTIRPFSPPPTTQLICQQEASNDYALSTSTNNCVVSSTTVNNFIHNSIRITFDNFIPICMHGENPAQTDTCITLSNFDLFNSARNLHALTNRQDIIPLCSRSTGTGPCVNNTMLCSRENPPDGCINGFRVVYSSNTGSTSVPKGYFVDMKTPCNEVIAPCVPNSSGECIVQVPDSCKVPDCTASAVNNNCQKIWGINAGNFVDTFIEFPSIQQPTDIADLTQQVTVKDVVGTQRSFTASIVRTPTTDQDQSKICVYEGARLVGCQARQAVPKPMILECDPNSPVVGITCTNNYFTPRFIASMSVRNHSTSALIEALSVSNLNTNNALVNLAGYDFTSFVTDDTFITSPFSGAYSTNPLTTYGVYKNNAAPINSSGSPTNAVYLYGLEYKDNKYVKGGTYACLNFPNLAHCSRYNKENCVLSRLANANIVDCSLFKSKQQLYPNLSLCPASVADCNQVDSIAGINGSGGINIYRCPHNYCYGSSSNAAVCDMQLDPNNRLDPSASFGNVIPDDKHYSMIGGYDIYASGVRDKTSIELNLCASVPQLVCSAITTIATANGNALWPETIAGELATGTCPAGYSLTTNSPLQRYCLVNAEARNASFEALDPALQCVYSAITFSVTNTYTPTTPPATYINGKNGGISFNMNNSYWLSEIQYNGTNNAIINITIPSIAALSSFKISQLLYKDFMLITLNSRKIMSGPYNFNSLSTVPTFPVVPGILSFSDINILPYLVQGTNTLVIYYANVQYGGIAYQIDYTLK